MPDVGAALRGRTFGVPNGLLLVAVAAGIWWFFIRGKTGAKATPQAAAAGSQLESGYGLGYTQGLQASQANQPPPPGAAGQSSGAQTITIRDRTSTGPYAQYDQTAAGVPVWLQPGTGQIGVVPFGSSQKLAANPSSGPQSSPGGLATNNRLGNPQPGPSNGFTTQYWGIQYGPVTAWVGANDVAGTGTAGGVGGGAPIRKHHIGSRSAWLHHDAHPLIGAPVKYAHYVRVGGPRTAAAHHANVHNVAAQAGVHPARVAMLNPVPTGLIRIA